MKTKILSSLNTAKNRKTHQDTLAMAVVVNKIINGLETQNCNRHIEVMNIPEGS